MEGAKPRSTGEGPGQVGAPRFRKGEGRYKGAARPRPSEEVQGGENLDVQGQREGQEAGQQGRRSNGVEGG